MPSTTRGPVRGGTRAIWIANVWPEPDGGRFPVKGVIGERLEVSADILREGHGALAAVLRYRAVKDTAWRETPMAPVGNDRWAADLLLEENTRYLYTVESWLDPYGTWAHDLEKRLAAGMEVGSELLEGAALLHAALAREAGVDRRRIEERLAAVERATSQAQRARLLLDTETAELMARYPDRSAATLYERELELLVERPRAQCAAWYELFPRSQGLVPGRHGTFEDCIARSPDIAAMGFDVLSLPPIHPIGRRFRKGRNGGPTHPLRIEPDEPAAIFHVSALPRTAFVDPCS